MTVNGIELNCDLGENVDPHGFAGEHEIMGLIDRANISCGVHAGDEGSIRRTVTLAVQFGVQIGAHPGYPDKKHFGRKPMNLDRHQLANLLLDQLAFLSTISEQLGGQIEYVKPHGALYHAVCHDQETAGNFLDALSEFERPLPVLGLPSCRLQGMCLERGWGFWAEGFADRRYHADGRLVARTRDDAVLTVSESVHQAIQLALQKPIFTLEGDRIRLPVDTICVHGDSPQALQVLRQIHARSSGF